MSKKRKIELAGQVERDFGRKYQQEFLEMTKFEKVDSYFSVFSKILLILTIVFVFLAIVRY
jgi:hypothetical protein